MIVQANGEASVKSFGAQNITLRRLSRVCLAMLVCISDIQMKTEGDVRMKADGDVHVKADGTQHANVHMWSECQSSAAKSCIANPAGLLTPDPGP